jgi:hypothetical protein
MGVFETEMAVNCFNNSVINSALVGTEDDVLLQEHGSSGSDSLKGKCDGSDGFRRFCYRKKPCTSLPFVTYCEFELQMGIKLFCKNFPSKILVCLTAPGIQYMKN